MLLSVGNIFLGQSCIASFSKFSISIQSTGYSASPSTRFITWHVHCSDKGPWTVPLNDRSTLWKSCVLCACTYSVDRTRPEFERFLGFLLFSEMLFLFLSSSTSPNSNFPQQTIVWCFFGTILKKYSLNLFFFFPLSYPT